MVTRILSGKSIRGLLIYNEHKVASGNAELILANRFGAEITDLELRDKLSRFEQLTMLNGRAKTNAIHVILNFDREDRLSKETLQRIAVDYMERLGFGEQPFLVYIHHDASHPHIHIVTTNIQDDGNRISIHNIGRDKDEKIRAAMQQEYGLVKAESKTKDPLIKGIEVGPAAYGKMPTRQSIYNIVTAVMREYKFTSLAEYNAVLREFNVIADRGNADSRMFERRGLIYAVLDGIGKRVGVPIKASSLAGKPVLSKVEEKCRSNVIKKKEHIGSLKDIIDKRFDLGQALSKQAFVAALRNQNVGVIFRHSDAGQVYGITYVDHNSRCVFNGSDLGKAYSAKGVLERIDKADLSESKQSNDQKDKLVRSRWSSEPAQDLAQSDYDKGLLGTLLQRPDFDPVSGLVSRRKKKKKKGSVQENDLGNQIR
ncbi:relaxase [Pedobacter sp. G11]|uniref:relaxase/mobilization nuclease domain-containing protein n=1 Tax=Pedobacter sp. G11 TaxID=2482728 RepID=UPI000F5F1100|nr:relaxase/mobilization nuclease domain-containing protein [Pedobacter sp. G11]AZI26448.1 relaxase [Pedobacter sp. G11]